MSPAPFTPSFGRWLQSPGPPFGASTRVALSDVFVAPVLRGAGTTTRIADPVGWALSADHVLLSGAQRIGRTTFAKRIIETAQSHGLVPVYARGDFLHADLSPDSVRQRVADLAADQHTQASGVPDLLVLDDLDLARIDGDRWQESVGRRAVLAAVTGLFPRVIALTTSLELARTVDADPTLPYATAYLGALGASKRADVAAHFAQAVAPIETWRAFVGPARRILDRLFSDGRIPAFPYYIHVALGELYTGDPARIDGTSFGAYYETVVRDAARLARDAARLARDATAR